MTRRTLPPVLILLLFLSTSGIGWGYDPLTPGPAPTVLDRDLAISANRTLPVRIFLPAGKSPSPVLIFSHGLGGSREGSNFLGRHWSSRGYVTIFLQHPGSDASIWKGKKPLEAYKGMKEAANIEQFLARTRDVTGTLDQLTLLQEKSDDPLQGRLDLKNVGMSGHSFGAKTTQALAGEQGGLPILPKNFNDPRIKAAIPMSPSPNGKVDPTFSFGKVTLPWLLMTGTHDGGAKGIVPTTPAERMEVYPALPAGNKYELVLFEAEHSAFTERALQGESKPRNPNHHRVILATSTAFWDAYLRQDAAARAWLKSDARSVMEKADRWQIK
jgi:predicted dienelactone hydrolase